jgi:ribose 1,5-bisphosphokinase PhnN
VFTTLVLIFVVTIDLMLYLRLLKRGRERDARLEALEQRVDRNDGVIDVVEPDGAA